MWSIKFSLNFFYICSNKFFSKKHLKKDKQENKAQRLKYLKSCTTFAASKSLLWLKLLPQLLKNKLLYKLYSPLKGF